MKKSLSGNPYELDEKLEGGRVRIKIAHKVKDGETDVVVRKYEPVPGKLKATA